MNWPLALNFFITMLAITNPITKISLWLQGSAGEDSHVRWRLAALVTITALIILLVFLVGGRSFLDLFGIDLASFRVGGGIVILLVGLDMLRGSTLDIGDGEADADPEAEKSDEALARFRRVAVPLAMPIMAGPGSISTAVVYSAQAESTADYIALAAALTVVMGIMFLVMLGARRIQRLTGKIALDIQTRVFGLLLAGIAVQLVAEGLSTLFPGLLHGGG